MIYTRYQKEKQKKQLSMMFTSITHELLTPLTIISASVEHLRDEEPKFFGEYELMEINIQRSVRLLQQILETSKSHNGSLKLLVSHGDVMAYIRETARSIIPLMAKRGLNFSISCTPESMMGWIDTDKMDKIIFNLLSNASKYTTSEDGQVELIVKTNSNYDSIVIEVKDNGCGIPKSRQKQLFKMFYDGEYRRYDTMGNGIGLALTKDLVYLHGGTISYEGGEGIGSTFIVVIPISRESFLPSQIDDKNKIDIRIPHSAILDFNALSKQNDTKSEKEKQQEEEMQNKDDAYKILIVEDNSELLNLMKQLLKRDYIVSTASNGKEALNVLKKREQDLIVSDVMMPEMDGYKLTKHVKNDPDYKHLPIILLTAKTQEEDRETSLRIGADDYMTKPFKMGELRLHINNLIENRQRIQNDSKNLSSEEETDSTETTFSQGDEFLSKATACIKESIADSEYDRDRFAADMGMSQSSLYNKLRATTGMSVSSFMRDIRMKEACRLMKDAPDRRISEIAYSVGYKDPKYFATTFKKETGMQPTEYIDKCIKRL